jgi:PDZ domain-containing protein
MKKILNYIKDNIIFIVVILFLFLIFNIKLPYYIEAPGGLININNRYEIEESYDIKGSINMTYVSEYKATIPTLIFAKFNKDMDIIKQNEIIYENETEKENEYRGKLMLNEASDNAIILAYKKANKEYTINNQEMYITYVDVNSKTNLKIGDRIISIDNNNVNSKTEINDIIKNKKVGDKINISVINDKKEYNRYAYILENNIIGIIVTYKRNITTYPKITINYEKNEYGSSGGLMTTLAIYNKLTSSDITKGKKIAGTGTIDENGNVGEIDGVKYKLKGAIKEKADIFLVPSGDNYKEALKLKKENNYNINIVEIKTFDDALDY